MFRAVEVQNSSPAVFNDEEAIKSSELQCGNREEVEGGDDLAMVVEECEPPLSLILVMIRRELPRTERAGWGRNRYRIERKEGSPFRGPCAIIGSAVLKYTSLSFSGCCGVRLLLLLHVGRDCPDEAEQLTADCGHDLILVLAAGRHGLVALVQPVLRFPGNLFHLIADGERLLSSQQESRHVRTVLIRPRRFHQHPSEMGVASFGDRTPLNAVAAGVFACHQTAVAHQLPRAREAGQRPEFGNNRGRGGLGYSAQSLQRFDNGPDLRRRLPNRLIDRLLEFYDPLGLGR